jgi:GxxExxY protein
MDTDGEKSGKKYEPDELTAQILGCAYEVANTLGSGFLEKVYENALAFELKRAGLAVEQQKPLQVTYKGAIAGEYQADLLVDGRVLIELKAAKGIEEVHLAQCLNYLKVTGLKTCLLLNFGTSRVGVRRISL